MSNIGIYALYWWEQNLIYIGLSQNLVSRKHEHFRKLYSNTHSNHKVQKAFDSYGLPEFIVLEPCSIEELPKKEIYWTKEFNALDKNTGLCIVEPGIVGFGTNSNASKYSSIQILKTFSLLYRGKHTFAEIAKRCNTSETICNDISNNRTHLWLKEAYPTQYEQMCSIKNRTHRKLLTIKKATLIDSTGSLYEVFGIKQFCRNVLGNETFSSSISRVINGTRKSCKGFTLHSVEP